MQSKSPMKFRYLILFLIKSMIVIFDVVSFLLCLFRFYSYNTFEDRGKVTFEGRGNIVLALLYFSLLLTLMVTYNCFRIGKVRLKDLSFSYFISLFLTNFFTYFILSLIGKLMLNPYPILVLTLVQLLFGILVYVIANSLYSILFVARDALFICGNSEYDVAVLEKFKSEYRRFDIRQVIDQNYDLDEIKRSAMKYSTMVLGNIDADLKSDLIEFCFVNKIQLYIIPSIDNIILQGAHYTNIDDSLLLFSRNQALSIEQRIIKRAIDLLVSSLLLIILSPLMLITALAIKLYDKGPVFFKQKRYTYSGKVFTLIKFRSMIVNAEENGAQLTVNNDPRITPIGKIIRMLRIDELPQLINILLGDMSLVGPRAERVENVDMYSNLMPEFRYRLKVKAGLTGYAQLYGKYNTSFEDKARMDIFYIVNYSLLLDLKLMFYTLKVLFSKDSTDGFSNNTLSDAIHDRDTSKSENK